VETFEETTDVVKPRPAWVRWLRRAGWGLLLVIVVLAGRQLWQNHQAHNRLQEMLAELDRTDPGWRLEDIEAARATVPEEQNSARCVMGASVLLPRDWPPREAREAFDHLTPNERLSPEDAALLDKELAEAEPALEEARRLADLPRGRHRLVWARNPLLTLLPDQQEVRKVTTLLVHDALRHGQAGDMKAALNSCRAAVNAGRSLGDEPIFVSQLVRTACVVVACQAVERALAQGEPAPEDMAALQKLLADEDAFPDLLVAMRGERAAMHIVAELLENGEVSLAEIAGGREDWTGRALGWYWRARCQEDHPLMLSLMTRLVATAQMPPQEQIAAERQLDQEVRNLPRTALLTRLLLPAFTKVGEASRRKHAYIRCTMAALAAERYRRAHKDWPATLDKLMPAMLTAVPADPFTGAPLRYRRTEEGVVIYSAGSTGAPLRYRRTQHPSMPGVDLGIRLWEVAKRRQPPKPKAPEQAPPVWPPVPAPKPE
jgi:hypothetical protein